MHVALKNKTLVIVHCGGICWLIGCFFSTFDCTGAGGESNYHFKTLVPAVAAGAIIGKGGETIAALQKETNARVKMSKSHDFYPGE